MFGPNADEPVDPVASRSRLQEVADALDGAKSLKEIAEGFLEIAVDNMAAAIRKISSPGAMTSPATLWLASVAPAASMPAGSPMRSAWSEFSSIPLQACFRPLASVWPK